MDNNLIPEQNKLKSDKNLIMKMEELIENKLSQ